MNFFSRHPDQLKSQESQPVAISRDILDAVTVMRSGEIASDDKVVEKIITRSHGMSPFLEKTDSQGLETAPIAQETRVFPLQKTDLKPSRFEKKRIVFLVFGGLVLCALFGSIWWWYFLRVRNQVEAVIPLPSSMESVIPEPTGEIVMSEPPYASETANYLLIDTETVTPASFAQMLKQSGERIVAAHMSQPVEFLLTDKNNNPIAFSRFAYLMKIDLKAELLTALGEPFSLFIYNDQGNIRLGLKLSFSDSVTAKKLINQNEKTLPFLFQALLFDGIVVSRDAVFRSGVYNAEVVRFVNIDVAENLSLDFVVRDDGMFIGTSRETLRMVLNKNR